MQLASSRETAAAAASLHFLDNVQQFVAIVGLLCTTV